MKIRRKCSYCTKSTSIEVDAKAYASWLNGTKIQDAFPKLSRGDREFIQTGFHTDCFDAYFAD